MIHSRNSTILRKQNSLLVMKCGILKTAENCVYAGEGKKGLEKWGIINKKRSKIVAFSWVNKGSGKKPFRVSLMFVFASSFMTGSIMFCINRGLDLKDKGFFLTHRSKFWETEYVPFILFVKRKESWWKKLSALILLLEKGKLASWKCKVKQIP